MLMVNQLVGFGAGGGVLVDAVTAALVTDNAGWNGLTIRTVINAAQVLNQGTGVTVTMQSSSITGIVLANAYIGHAAAAGDAYDFESTPTQLLFAGSGSTTIAAGASKTSDEAAFTIQPSKNLIVSMYFNGASDLKILNAATGWNTYYVSGSDAATPNTTGYSTFGNIATAVNRIQVRV